MKEKTEELYEKCRALISVLSFEINEEDRAALVWILEDYYKELGESIGLVLKK